MRRWKDLSSEYKEVALVNEVDYETVIMNVKKSNYLLFFSNLVDINSYLFKQFNSNYSLKKQIFGDRHFVENIAISESLVSRKIKTL